MNIDNQQKKCLAKNGNSIYTVSFADEAYAYLDRKGYTAEEKMQAIGISFQVWRAFYFIVRNLAGSSASMRKLRESLWNNVFTHNMEFYTEHLWQRMEDFSTIITGETGTGKGTAAMAIGRSGYIPFDEKKKCFKENFARSFVTLNLSQFPETLIEVRIVWSPEGSFYRRSGRPSGYIPMILSSSRQRTIALARFIICCLAVDQLLLSAAYVASRLNLTPSAVSKLTSRGCLETETRVIDKELPAVK